MSEIPDEANDNSPELPADFLNRLYSETQPLTAMDFLPTNSPGSGDTSQETSGSDPASWNVKQIHFIGNTAVRGDHPSEAGREAVRQAREYLDAKRQRMDDVLATTPHLNPTFAREIQDAQELLVRDFGERASGDLFHVIREEDFSKTIGVNVLMSVADSGRHVVIGVDEALARSYGPCFMIRTCLAGGVMAAAQAENVIVTADHLPRLARFLKHDASYRIAQLPYGNLNDVTAQENGVIVPGASYLANGFIESYAIEGSLLLGASNNTEILDDDILQPYGSDWPAVGHSNGYNNTPYIRQQTGRLMLPYKYMTGLSVQQDEDGAEDTAHEPAHMYTSQSSIAALGFDLLDNRAPGLRQAMRDLIINPDARERVKGLVDGVKPGLYKELFSLDDNIFGYYEGTKHVLKTLGLTDAPVGTGLDIY